MQIPSGHGGLHGQGYFWGTAGGLNGYLGPCSTFGPLLGVLLVLYKGNTDLWGLLVLGDYRARAILNMGD